MNNQSKAILKSLAEMAWADGRVSDEERTLLLSVCLQLGADGDDLEELKRVLGEPDAPARLGEDLKTTLLDKESRLNVMRVLMTMSFIDGVLGFAEFEVIERKAAELGLSAEEMETLRTEALAAAERFKTP